MPGSQTLNHLKRILNDSSLTGLALLPFLDQPSERPEHSEILNQNASRVPLSDEQESVASFEFIWIYSNLQTTHILSEPLKTDFWLMSLVYLTFRQQFADWSQPACNRLITTGNLAYWFRSNQTYQLLTKRNYFWREERTHSRIWSASEPGSGASFEQCANQVHPTPQQIWRSSIRVLKKCFLMWLQNRFCISADYRSVSFHLLVSPSLRWRSSKQRVWSTVSIIESRI